MKRGCLTLVRRHKVGGRWLTGRGRAGVEQYITDVLCRLHKGEHLVFMFGSTRVDWAAGNGWEELLAMKNSWKTFSFNIIVILSLSKVVEKLKKWSGGNNSYVISNTLVKESVIIFMFLHLFKIRINTIRRIWTLWKRNMIETDTINTNHHIKSELS